MIRHTVMWRLKEQVDEAAKTHVATTMKALLEALPGHIAEIQQLEVGLNLSPSPAAADVVLSTTFRNLEDLETYRNHHKHQKVVAYIREVAAEIWVVDYEL